jgi:hypothetical protein
VPYAESGEPLEKSAKKAAVKARPAKKKSKARPAKKRAAAPLPEPVEVGGPEVRPASAEEKSLLSKLFGGDQSNPNPSTPQHNPAPSGIESVTGSGGSSIPNCSEPLSAEAERILAGVPATVGGEADDPGGPADFSGSALPGSDDAAELVALMDCVMFTPEDVAGTVAEWCDHLATWLDSDHWRISEGQQRLLGKPYATLANGMWGKVKQMLPGWLASTCETTPGLAGSFMVTAAVFGPKVMQQLIVSRMKKKAGPRIVKPNNEPAPAPAPAPAHTGPFGRTPLRVPEGIA